MVSRTIQILKKPPGKPPIPSLSIDFNLEDFPGERLNLLNRRQSLLDPSNRTLTQSLPTPRVEINTSRRKQRLGEISNNPRIAAILLAPTEYLPMTTGNKQPALTTPVPGIVRGPTHLVHAVHGAGFVAVERLVAYHVV